MSITKNSLLNQWSYDHENAEKPTQRQSKTHILQAKVSPTRLDEIDSHVAQSECYSNRSELVRQGVRNELDSSKVQLEAEILDIAKELKQEGELASVQETVEIALAKVHQEVCKGYEG